MSHELVVESLTRAAEHHKAGWLDEAERLYRDILENAPWQADALHLLGVICHQRGRSDVAVALIGRALAARPGQAVFHGNLAEAWRALGNLGEAQEHAEAALRLEPDSVVCHNTLGLALQGRG